MPYLRQREEASVALQPIHRSWPLLRGPWNLWDVKQEQLSHRTLGCCSRKPWLRCRHPHQVSSLHWWSSADHLPAKARAGKASSKVERELWDRLITFTEVACISQVNVRICLSLCPPGTSLMQGHGTTTVCQNQLCHPKPCKDFCSWELLCAWLCWMQVRIPVVARALPFVCCFPLPR